MNYEHHESFWLLLLLLWALTDNDNDNDNGNDNGNDNDNNKFMYYSDGARGIAQKSSAQASATAMQTVGRLEGPTVATVQVKVLNGAK
jgi:hypothetical protein